jgi:SsrA-binding protein
VASKKKKTDNSSTIALNKKARFDYHLEERIEAGIALEGWEVKSLRAGRVQIKESYVIIRHGELFLFGAHISPLISASTHVNPDPTRLRKLLLNRKEISHLIGSVERKGYTIVPVALYWKKGRAKLEIALAKGKQMHDKRAAIKDREWKRDKERLMKHGRT